MTGAERRKELDIINIIFTQYNFINLKGALKQKIYVFML